MEENDEYRRNPQQEHTVGHLSRIEHKLDYIIRKVEIMAVSEEQFQADFSSFLDSFNELLAAVDVIASKPATDLTSEDNAVLAAAQAAKDELAKISPPVATTPPDDGTSVPVETTLVDDGTTVPDDGTSVV